MTIAAVTLGCKVNYCDTDEILRKFAENGWEVADFADSADVYLVNTCAVTNVSEKKSRQMIRRAREKNPLAVVVATGCYVKVANVGIDGVLCLPREEVYDGIAKLFEGAVGAAREFETPRRRAFIKVEDGCENFCAYCVIPYARGAVKSRLIGEVAREIGGLARNGCKEIVLSGICLSNFGQDTGESFTDLITAAGSGIGRLRLGSLEPTVVTDGFVRAIRGVKALCPHFHLSLQSGCDKVLAAMNRKYTADEYFRAAERLRDGFPDCSITTDVIAGFPGESGEDFAETLDFAEKVGFMKIHAFPYSAKSGTRAAGFAGQVPRIEKARRVGELIKLSEKTGRGFYEKFIGTARETLVEEYDAKTRTGRGYTDNYMPVTFTGRAEVNEVVKVLLGQETYIGSVLV